jgi:hypothetical protein
MAGEWSPGKLPAANGRTEWSLMASTSDFVGRPHGSSSLARIWQFVPKGNISLRSERSRSYRSCVIYNKSHWLLDIMAGIIKLYNLIVHLIRQGNECGHRMRTNIRCNASTGSDRERKFEPDNFLRGPRISLRLVQERFVCSVLCRFQRNLDLRGRSRRPLSAFQQMAHRPCYSVFGCYTGKNVGRIARKA